MIFVINPSHGGIAAGYYFTPGHRSPQVPPGIYEGEFNRKVAELISLSFSSTVAINKIVNINPGPINVPLKTRAGFVNKLVHRERCVLVTIDANASPDKGWSNANGFTIFCSWRASKNSKRLAALAEKYLKAAHTGIESRGIKQVNHTMTTKTRCPAILIECGFMTNKKEATLLAEYKTQHRIADAIASALREYEAFT